MLKVFTLRKCYVKISEPDRTVRFTHETQINTVLPYATERERQAEEERQAEVERWMQKERERGREGEEKD